MQFLAKKFANFWVATPQILDRLLFCIQLWLLLHERGYIGVFPKVVLANWVNWANLENDHV